MNGETAARGVVWLRSPEIKAWKDPGRTLSILTGLAAGWAPGARLELDLEVPRHGRDVAAQCDGLETLSGGAAPPPRGLIARALGLASGPYAVRLALRSPEEIGIALAGEAVWDADFMLRPLPTKPPRTPREPELSNLFEFDVGWALVQMTGKFDWLLAAREQRVLDQMVVAAKTVFERNGSELKIIEQTGATQIALGSKVFDLP